MRSFFKISKRTFLCGDCGGQTRHQKLHTTRPAHVKAIADRAYRHRDDSPHSTRGPTGCYVCAVLRRAAREAGYTDPPERVAKMLAATAAEMGDELMGDELVATKPPPPVREEPPNGATATGAADTIDHDEVLRQLREDQGDVVVSLDPEPQGESSPSKTIERRV